jgi:hypothetical protein
MGSGQGWAGAFHVLYHTSADVSAMFQSPPGATNWIVGFEGTLGDKTVEFDGDDATFLDPEPNDIGHIPRSLYWSQLVARMGGTQSAAEYVEKIVGAAGKSQYSEPLKRKFVTMDEIVLADGAIRSSSSSSRLEADMDLEEDEEMDEEAEASIAQLQKDIQRMELEIKEAGYKHLLNDNDDEGNEEDIW